MFQPLLEQFSDGQALVSGRQAGLEVTTDVSKLGPRLRLGAPADLDTSATACVVTWHLSRAPPQRAFLASLREVRM
jgi:hypothetical protein